MENLSRINFWIVILYFCFPAKAFPVNSNIDLMAKNVKCDNDSLFYAPENVESNCITEALDCIVAELQTVKKECEDPEVVIGLNEESFIDLIQKQKDTMKDKRANSTECMCESWPEKSFTGFIEAIKNLSQRIESAG